MSIREIMTRLFTFVQSFRTFLFLSLIMAIISVILNLYAPLLIGDIIDAIAAKQSMDTILSSFLCLIAVYITYSLSTWGMTLCTNHIAFAIGYTLRKELFLKLEKLPVSFFDTQKHGDLMSRFTNDIDMIADGLLQGLATLLSGVVTIVMAVIFMLNINFYMTWIVLLCAPFTFMVAKTITKRSHKYFIAQTNDLGKLNAHTQEMFNGIRTLKAYGREDASYQMFRSLNDQLYASGKNSQFYGSLVNPSTRLVTNTSYTIVGVCGALFALANLISVGQISSFLLYSNIFSKPFNEISGVMTQLQSAAAGAQRIFALYDQAEESNAYKQVLSQVKGHVQFVHVSFGYDPGNLLMQDLNLDIPAGSRVAIVGKTGAGKTTLINLLMRFYEVNSGSILLDGVDITKCARENLRSHFGMVLQDTFLKEDSIYHILAYGKKDAAKEEIIEAAKRSGAHAFIEKLPDGYDTVLRDHSFLSQGQRQLLSITRVMVMDPEILILDEATSNMDTRSEAIVNAAMDSLMKGKTGFVIAHRLSTIIHSDLILVIDQGNIVEQGTHDELLAKNGAYATLYNSQFAHMQKDI